MTHIYNTTYNKAAADAPVSTRRQRRLRRLSRRAAAETSTLRTAWF